MPYPLASHPIPPAPAPGQGARADPLDALLRATLDARSWLTENPGMAIDGRPGALAPSEAPSARPLPEEEISAAMRGLVDEGYLEMPDLFAGADAARMEAAVCHLRHLGLPPVFLFVYDEPWQLVSHLCGVLGAALGPAYRQLPDFWAWYIAQSEEDRGWVPHRDRPLVPKTDTMPGTLTLWVALSEATPRNGCMYILPRGRDPRYGTSEVPDIARANLQDLRALPASPGTAILWDQDVYHWGGRSSAQAQRPRVSFACEFQRGELPPCNRPLLDPHRAPVFHDRLRLIGKQLRQYQHMHALSPLLGRLAERLVLL